MRVQLIRYAITVVCVTSWSLVGCGVRAQTFRLSSAEVADSAALARSMPRLAAEVLAAYKDGSSASYLGNRFRLQLFTGNYPDARASLDQLRKQLAARPDATPQDRALYVQYEMLTRARVLAERSGRPFPEAF